MGGTPITVWSIGAVGVVAAANEAYLHWRQTNPVLAVAACLRTCSGAIRILGGIDIVGESNSSVVEMYERKRVLAMIVVLNAFRKLRPLREFAADKGIWTTQRRILDLTVKPSHNQNP